MRHEVRELENFPDAETIQMPVDLIKFLSPDSYSVMELKSQLAVDIVQKMSKMPKLGEEIVGKWSIKIQRELNMTDDADLFYKDWNDNMKMIPLYEGKLIHQFTHRWEDPRYWLREPEVAERLLTRRKKQVDKSARLLRLAVPNHLELNLDYRFYRLGFRDVAASTNERSMIMTVLPKNVVCPHTMSLEQVHNEKASDTGINPNHQLINNHERLLFCAIMNSFVVDFYLRQSITNHLSFFFVYSTPVPRLVQGDPYFNDIVERAAKLICTTPEFDDLAAEVGLGSYANGVTDEAERAQLRAELDGRIAHLYGLTEDEFTHILSTFPIVPEATKQAALEEYRKLLPKVGDQQILDLIAQGESAQLEFKSTARWDLKENKKNPVMEEVILKTVAAFLNSDGGTLLIGVDDDGNVLGLQPDYQTLRKKDRDGFELWLMGDLLLKALGNDLAPQVSVSFGMIENKEVCKVTVQPSPRPIYCEIKNKNGQPEECFLIRAGNQTKRLTKPSEIMNYTQTRWA